MYNYDTDQYEIDRSRFTKYSYSWRSENASVGIIPSVSYPGHLVIRDHKKGVMDQEDKKKSWRGGFGVSWSIDADFLFIAGYWFDLCAFPSLSGCLFSRSLNNYPAALIYIQCFHIPVVHKGFKPTSIRYFRFWTIRFHSTVLFQDRLLDFIPGLLRISVSSCSCLSGWSRIRLSDSPFLLLFDVFIYWPPVFFQWIWLIKYDIKWCFQFSHTIHTSYSHICVIFLIGPINGLPIIFFEQNAI